MSASAGTMRRGGRPRQVAWIALAVIGLAALAVTAVRRGGLLDLPPVPAGVDASRAGLDHLDELAARARILDAAAAGTVIRASGGDSALALAAAGLAAIHEGNAETGLETLRRGLARAPEDLVLGNAFRMAVFGLRSRSLSDPAARTTLAAQVPGWLEHEPFATLDHLYAVHPGRGLALQRALAWSDELVLYGALEIKAPSSVESVRLFSELLQSDPVYVPALFGRGLNYLYRPRRLEWPEARKMAPDAASRDLGTCVAIGRKIGGASPRLVATLALTLGDAYAKEGDPEQARSWWQIALNSCREPDVGAAVRRRLSWPDGRMLDELEAALAEQMQDAAHPLTDLSVMWR